MWKPSENRREQNCISDQLIERWHVRKGKSDNLDVDSDGHQHDRADCGGHARGTHDRLLLPEVNIEFREEFQ